MSEEQITLTDIGEQEGGHKKTRVGPKSVIIPAEWDVKILDEIASVSGGKRLPKGHSYSNQRTDYPYIRVVDFENGSVSTDELKYINKDTHKEIQRYAISDDDVYISIAGTLGIAGTIPESISGSNLTENAAKIHDLNGIHRDYLSYYIRSKFGQDEVHRFTVGSTQPKLSLFRLRKLETILPPLPEQRKIATVLYTVDRAIEKTEETLSQLNRVKQGLYQTLFSEGYQQHDQFKQSKYGGVPAEWGISKLSEVTSQIQAGGTPDTDVPEYYGGDIPWVKTGELSQYRVTETGQTITETGLQESTARLFSPGTILIAMYGATTGEVSLLDTEATTNQACCGVVTTDEMRPEFLFHQLNYLSTHLESLSAGSGQQNISKGIIEKFDVLVPSIEEQDSIVRVLNAVDKSIAENETTKNQYRRLKRGLMQDLLSGTVRTTDTNIEVPDEIAQYG